MTTPDRPMPPRHRIKKPALDRTGPRRGGTAELFGARRPEAPAQRAPGTPLRPADAAQQGVWRAYDVIDDQIRLGRNAARQIAKRSYTASAFANDFQDAAAHSMKFIAELFDLWLQMASAFASTPSSSPTATPTAPANPMATAMANAMAANRGGAPIAPQPTSPPMATAPAVPRAESRVVVSIESSLPTELTLDLPADGRSISIRALEGPGDPISDVEISGAQPPRLRFRVGERQAPGVYSALAVDATTHQPVGSVTLEVREPRPSGPTGIVS